MPTRMPVACFGLGDLGTFEARCFADMEALDVVAGADVDPDARADFEDEFDAPAYADHSALLEAHGQRLGFVSVATPHACHYGQVRDCLDRGIDVHVEKPLATDPADAYDLVERARSGGLTLAVGYQRHYDRRYRELRRVVDAGRIGTPHMAVCHLEQVWISNTADTWRADPGRSGGGQLFDSGSHLLDALCFATRADPVSVAAEVDDCGHDVDVNAALSARFDRDGDRLTASVGVSGAGRSIPSPGERIELLGTDGAVVFDGETITVREAGVTYEATPPAPDFGDLTRAKLRNAVEAARGETDLEVPPETAAKVVALSVAAVESAERGRRVEVVRPTE